MGARTKRLEALLMKKNICKHRWQPVSIIGYETKDHHLCVNPHYDTYIVMVICLKCRKYKEVSIKRKI